MYISALSLETQAAVIIADHLASVHFLLVKGFNDFSGQPK